MKNWLKKSGFTLTELLVVVGIFSLIIGACFTLLSSSRLSVNIHEASIQAAESSRRAMERITRELRLSQAGRIRLYNDLVTEGSTVSGQVIYLQVPVVDAAGELVLASGRLTWGTEQTQGDFIYYFLGGDNNDQLFRGSCSGVGIGVSNAGVIIAPYISSISFSQGSPSSELIDVEIVGEAEYLKNPRRTVTQTLRSSIKLRN